MFVILIIMFFLALIMITWANPFRYNPAWTMMFFWMLNVMIAVISFPEFPWNYMGIFWVFVLCSSFSFSFIIVQSIFIKELKQYRTEYKSKVDIHFNYKIGTKVLIVSIILAYIYFFINTLNSGFSIKSLLNLEALININAQNAYDRYNSSGSSSLYMQLLLVFVYSSTMMGGFYFSFAKTIKQKLLGISSIIPELLILLTENTKNGLLVCIIFWSTSYITGFLIQKKQLPKLKLITILKLSLTLLLIIMTFLLSMIMRIGSFNKTTINYVINKFLSYGFGQIPAFDYWFKTIDYKSLDNTMGMYTFFGIFNFLGISSREQGVYIDGINMANVNTNIYTPFRGLIQDYGLSGSIIFMLILGGISAIAYRKVIVATSIPVISLMLTIAIYSFMLNFTVSIWSYFSFVLSFGVLGCYLLVVSSKHNKINKEKENSNEGL